MSTPIIGRTAKIYINDVAVGYAKGVDDGVDVDVIKDWSLDSQDPAVLEYGNRSYPLSFDKMYISNTYADLILAGAGTKVTVVILPAGTTSAGSPKREYANVVLKSEKVTRTMDGVLMEKVTAEAKSVTYGAYS